MNIFCKYFLSFSLTKLLLIITATTTITIFTVLLKQPYFLFLFYFIFSLVAFYKKQIELFYILLISLMFSVIICIRINQQFKHHKSHQWFLKNSVTLTGVILQKNRSSIVKDQITLTVQLHQISNKNSEEKLSKIISICLPTKRSKFLHTGQTIKIIDAKLSQATPQSKYELYLIKENIWATLYITKETIKIIKRTPFSFTEKFIFKLHKNLEKKAQELFNPLFLGKQDKNNNSVFLRHYALYWGISHHMARSGIHLTALFGLLLLLLNFFPLNQFCRYFISALLCIGYFKISFPSISFCRAFMMIMFQLFAKAHHCSYSGLHALTLTTLIIILNNPMQVMFLDFQLSFGITYCIIGLFTFKSKKIIALPKDSSLQF